jgi:hypothetical protein
MDTLSLIVVSDHTKPVRRFELPKLLLKRAAIGAGIFAVVLLGLGVDYVRLRIDNYELNSLRKETLAHRAQVSAFEKKMGEVDSRLAKISELERKVRIIANLPGSVASGGDEVTPIEPEVEPGGQGGGDEPYPSNAPVRRNSRIPVIPADAGVPERVSLLDQSADYLGAIAADQGDSLEDLLVSLEGKREKLASSPSIWPSRGWLTSTYGNRVSPFTNRTQFHAGIDIAGSPGTDVVAPARGRVVFVGPNGPLGNSVKIDHGYGVRRGARAAHRRGRQLRPQHGSAPALRGRSEREDAKPARLHLRLGKRRGPPGSGGG